MKSQDFKKSTLQLGGIFGNLNHYNFTFNNDRYCFDNFCGLEATLHWRQYFLERNAISVTPDLGDYVVDGGACLGDTAAVFSNAVGKDGMVYSFDPLRDHLDVLEKNISQFPIKNVKIMPFGIGNEDVYVEPIRCNGYNPGFNIGPSTAPLRKIDSLFKNGTLNKIDYIKLDIEGFEMQALLGARESINNCKPKLAVSLYHNTNDMFEIILYIKKTHPFYDFYIDHYTIHREETILYCDPFS